MTTQCETSCKVNVKVPSNGKLKFANSWLKVGMCGRRNVHVFAMLLHVNMYVPTRSMHSATVHEQDLPHVACNETDIKDAVYRLRHDIVTMMWIAPPSGSSDDAGGRQVVYCYLLHYGKR